MASISGNGALGHHKFTLTVTETATSTENNTSTISYSFQLAPIQTSWAWEQWSDKISYVITINGTKYTGTIPNYDGYATVTLKSGTQTVTHDSDGSKSISYSFSVTDNAGQRYTPGNASASGTLVLTTIPRATTPTLSAATVVANGSNSITINIAPAANTFKHRLRYSFGSYTSAYLGFYKDGVQMTTNDFTAPGKTTITFKPDSFLCNQIPNANSGICTIYLYTFTASGTHIGTKSVNLTLNVPSYTPTISNIALTGNNLLSGEYVQGKSTVKATITASSSYGATIKTISSTVDGKPYSGNSFTSSVLSNGNKTVSVTVTDTRGKTATLNSSSFMVYAYGKPIITSVTAVRQSDGTTVIATVMGNIASVNNKNAKSITVTLNGVTQTITSDSYAINGSTTFTNVPTDNTFTCTAKLTDSYTNVAKDVVLPTVAVTMDFHHSGKGIAMGKVAEKENLFEVNWETTLRKGANVSSPNNGVLTVTRENSAQGATIKFANANGTLGYLGMSENADTGIRRWKADLTGAYFVLDTGNLTNHIKDYIVEQGASGIWTYRKWNSGVAECWCNAGTTPTTVNGNNAFTINLPFAFVGTDYKVTITPAKAAMYIGAVGDCATNGNITHTTTSFTMSYKYSFATAYAVSFNINVYGKWK